MKIKTLIAYFIFTCAISSCIQDEALNSEAAIDVCSGDDVQLANIDADSKVINVYVNKGADLSKQKLEFTLPCYNQLVLLLHFFRQERNIYEL